MAELLNGSFPSERMWIGTPIPVKMYYNPKAESCIKTLKVEVVYLMDYDTFADVIADLPRFGERETGHPSPLVSYARPAAAAEQVCSPVNIALHERAPPVPKIEVQRENALSAHKALVGLHQQIVPLKCAHRNEPALDQNVVVGETGHRRCHENTIAYEGRGAETGATLYPDEIAVG